MTLITRIDNGGIWIIELNEKWELTPDISPSLDAKVILDPNVAWKLFSKSLRPAEVRDQVSIEGDERLGNQALNLLGFMA
ncbi:hypothetical protein [Algoriphagus mannitolivorans]|uniref:hypothetical protein n=1 Tax=Algoriphagus mannitolivorans TaxID=226504 RepID=UPI000479DB3C|nr:hypothetical protein [Algoriphagus mannitolivorans]